MPARPDRGWCSAPCCCGCGRPRWIGDRVEPKDSSCPTAALVLEQRGTAIATSTSAIGQVALRKHRGSTAGRGGRTRAELHVERGGPDDAAPPNPIKRGSPLLDRVATLRVMPAIRAMRFG